MVYKNKNINTLLEKYWEGETSVEEEKILQNFFAQKEVPEEFKKVQPLFAYFRNQTSVSFDEKKVTLIEEDNDQVVIRMQPQLSRSIWTQLRPIFQIAASIILVVGFSFVIWNQYDQQNTNINIVQQDTFEDPEKAQATVEMALKFVSKKLNKGTRKANGGLKKVNKPFKIIHPE